VETLTLFTFVAAVGFVVWGYLVGIRRNLSLVPLYSPGRIKNKHGFALWIGYNLMGMGTLGGIDGLLQAFFPVTHVSMFLAYAIIIVPAMSIRMIIGMKRYEAG
jgi:hypothetical protein